MTRQVTLIILVGSISLCAAQTCDPGYEDDGAGTCTDINECQDTDGKQTGVCNMGVCENKVGGYTCRCITDYFGPACDIKACTDPCEFNSYCVPSVNCSDVGDANYTVCYSQTDENFCSSPVCEPPCEHGACTDPDVCTCNQRWQGERCKQPMIPIYTFKEGASDNYLQAMIKRAPVQPGRPDPYTNVSVTLWLRTTGIAEAVLFAFKEMAANYEISLRKSTSIQLVVTTRDGTVNKCVAPSSVADETWHFVAIVWQAGNNMFLFYVDSELAKECLVDSLRKEFVMANGHFYIGANVDGQEKGLLTGDVADFRVFPKYVLIEGFVTMMAYTRFCSEHRMHKIADLDFQWQGTPIAATALLSKAVFCTAMCKLPYAIWSGTKIHDTCTCSNVYGVTCTCPSDGFQGNGTHCVDINECKATTSPCNCPEQGSCINTVGDYVCQCLYSKKVERPTEIGFFDNPVWRNAMIASWVGAVVMVAVGIGVYCWRRHVRNQKLKDEEADDSNSELSGNNQSQTTTRNCGRGRHSSASKKKGTKSNVAPVPTDNANSRTTYSSGRSSIST